MAEDRIDEAIDAVIRAVDRIERATRGAATPSPEPARRGLQVPKGPSPPPHDLGPPPQQTAFAAAPATSVTGEFAALTGERPAPPAATQHELIGRIVATTQQLEDHLAAARALRAELSELVNRLAAGTQPPPVL